MDDITLLKEYARTGSESAFSAVVERHVGMVYAAAIRQVQDPQAAEDITQAVFIVLARKSGRLAERVVLAGWLLKATRYAASAHVRGAARRSRREQEAYMQFSTNDTAAFWNNLAPLLDEALASLGDKDRSALALRYFEDQTAHEIAEELNLSEAAVNKRIGRALEKLRKFFAGRGVHSTTTIIASAISAHSAQMIPAALSKSVTAAAFSAGAGAPSSLLPLIKGAMRISTWTKAQTVLSTGLTALLIAGAATVAVEKFERDAWLKQRLQDGTMLVLNHIFLGNQYRLVHGNTAVDVSWMNSKQLCVEFGVTGAGAGKSALVKPAFLRQFRCVIHGETGIEYIEEFMPWGFKKYSDGYFNCVITSIFPRNSKWLWFRIEKSDTDDPFGPWKTIANFRVRNPGRPANQSWAGRAVPATNSVAGMDFVLNELSVETRPYQARDIWNHVVSFPTAVFSNGISLTNWSLVDLHSEDESGNYNTVLQKWRSLDPDHVWKMEMSFEPTSNFSSDKMATLDAPPHPFTNVTGIANLPVTIYSDGHWLRAEIPTNLPTVALEFVNATDDKRNPLRLAYGGGSQFEFSAAAFMDSDNSYIDIRDYHQPIYLTFAIVPMVHTTFYVKPRLIRSQPSKS